MTLPLAGGGQQEDGEAVLDFLARHPATAHHLAFQLCQRFVADNPPAKLVDRVADVYRRTDGLLIEVYRAIFFSPEFWAKEFYDNKTKTPLELVVSAIRSVDGTVDGDPGVMKAIANMGEPLYQMNPPTGYSDTSDAWVNAGALVQRINFGMSLAHGRVHGASVMLPALPGTADADAALDALALRILQKPLSPTTRKTAVAAMTSRRDPGLDPQPLPFDVAKAVGLLWGSPEFQKQ
jgi:uncharacterized protein (DUF1800 family)